MTCETTTDCDGTTCVDGVCERALVLRGTAIPVDPAVLYAAQRIVRVDFTAPPTGIDLDMNPVVLSVSTGAYVSSTVSLAMPGARVLVDGVPMVNPTGETFYPSISPSYFGVGRLVADPGSATASYNALLGAGLNGQPVENVVIDTLIT